MTKFDPSSMSENTSPTVRSLRTFVERTMEDEIERVLEESGQDAADLVETSLRAVVFRIFHKNPEVHSMVLEDRHFFDNAVQQLFAITDAGDN